MNGYLDSVNAGYFYLLVAGVMAFITAICVVFLVKSYKAGIALGMEPKELKKCRRKVLVCQGLTCPILIPQPFQQ